MADLDNDPSREDILRDFEFEQNEYWNSMVPETAQGTYEAFLMLANESAEYQLLHEQLMKPLDELDLMDLKKTVLRLLNLHKSLTRRAVFASQFK